MKVNDASLPNYMISGPGDGAKKTVRLTGLDLLELIAPNCDEKIIVAADLISEVARQISHKRIELGMTRKEMAKKLGVSARTIKRWEDADCDFTLSTIARLMVTLGVPNLEKLFGEKRYVDLTDDDQKEEAT